jgi:DNA-binding transcriptional regulator YhcF (GntR family)
MEMTEKQTPILSVDFKHYYDNISDGVTYQARACISMEAIQNGLIKEVGANRLPLLLAILSHMDKDGRAFPSQRKLAELTGQSVNTVNKLINELLEIEIDGQRLLRRELVGSGARKRSMYFIHTGEVTNSDAVAELKEQKAKAEAKTMNSRDVADYFNEVYKDTFGQGYTINYSKELGLIKKKLLPNYDDEAIKGIIDIAVRQYKERWANANYPLPTISMLCSWLANKAYGIYMQEKQKAQQLQERMQKAVEQDDTDRALDLFDI